MTENKEPVLITAKGEMNTVAWSKWYRETTGANAVAAQYAFNERVQTMPEPVMEIKPGKINKLWIIWYRTRKKVSTNTAMNVAKRRLKAIAEGRKPLEEHLTAWW